MVIEAGRRELPRHPPAVPRAAIVLLAAAGLLVLLLVVASSATLAADPSAVPGELLYGGDPRSEGSGPGLVGSPVGVLLAVVALGLATALVTAVLARMGSRR